MVGMLLETFPVGPLRCNCSILGDETTGEAMVIDPGDNVAYILERLAALRLTLKQIVVTHGHIDHVGGALQLKRATSAPILMHKEDLLQLGLMDAQARWLGVPTPEVATPDEVATDGMVIGLANYPASVLHTPGHTEGSISLYLAPEHLLFSGDTLFAGSIGRTDLFGGDEHKILRSIHARILVLPDETRVIPGHGAETTIGNERETNPWLKNKP